MIARKAWSAILAAMTLISSAGFAAALDCTDKNTNGCQEKLTACKTTAETIPASAKGCATRWFYEKNKAVGCISWKKCWNESDDKKESGGVVPGHADVCHLADVAPQWMKSVPLIEEANSKLVLARDALECVVDETKCKSTITDAVKTSAKDQFKLEKFGLPGTQESNRTAAFKNLSKGQEDLLNIISDIAKEDNDTCRECTALSQWHVLRAAVYFVNLTQTYDDAKDRIGYAKEKKDVQTGQTTPQAYEGRFSDQTTGESFAINQLTQTAMQAEDAKLFVLDGLKPLVCEAATKIATSKPQAEISATAKLIQSQLENLSGYARSNADWTVAETADDTAQALALGKIDEKRIAGDKNGTPKCKGASYVLPEEVSKNTDMADFGTRAKFITFGQKLCASASTIASSSK